MAELLTLDSTLRVLRSGMGNLSERAQRQLTDYANDLEKRVRPSDDMSPPSQQAILARCIEQRDRIIDFQDSAASLFDDLAAVGLDVENVYDLRLPGVGDARAVPALLASLSATTNRALRWQILSVLSAAWAKDGVVDALFSNFGSLNSDNDPEPNSLRSVIMWTLNDHAREVGVDRFLAVARDPVNGEARANAVRGLGKFSKNKDRVIPELVAFLDSDDAELFLPAAEILARWKISGARPRLQELIDTVEVRHQRNPVQPFNVEFERDELRKALWKILPSGQ